MNRRNEQRKCAGCGADPGEACAEDCCDLLLGPTYRIKEGEAAERIAEIYQDAIDRHDPVNHPKHYTAGGIETIDFIEAKGLDYHCGNAVKYIARHQLKGNPKQDLEKAVWYLQRRIDELYAEEENNHDQD